MSYITVIVIRESFKIVPTYLVEMKCHQFQAYTTNQKLKFHKLTHQGGNQFPCPHCDKILKTPATLQGHIKGKKYEILGARVL